MCPESMNFRYIPVFDLKASEFLHPNHATQERAPNLGIPALIPGLVQFCSVHTSYHSRVATIIIELSPAFLLFFKNSKATNVEPPSVSENSRTHYASLSACAL